MEISCTSRVTALDRAPYDDYLFVQPVCFPYAQAQISKMKHPGAFSSPSALQHVFMSLATEFEFRYYNIVLIVCIKM